MQLMKYQFNSVLTLSKNYVKSAKNGVFGRFGGSVGFTEASAESFRPFLAEASAEASVSVVHYLFG